MKTIIKNNKWIIAAVFTISSLFLSCSDFLNDPSVQTDPNRAINVSSDLLFTSIQVSGFYRYEGALSRTANVWMQQLSGVDRQLQSMAQYVWTEDDHSGQFSAFYTGGGLIDLRKIRAEADAKGWKAYSGIAKIWEAFSIGTAASLWGDIPYSEAVSNIATPKLDRQADVYAAVQILLDQAIADLTDGSGYKPAALNDFAYGMNLAKWIALAHSLKARYYLHWAEVNPGNYALALTQASQGIASNAGDFKSKHSTVESESNGYYQFWRDRSGYIKAAKFMVELLKTRGDGRLPLYFSQYQNQYLGADPGQATQSVSDLSAGMLAKERSQDILTYTETLLIWAECAFKTGDEATALSKLNAARRAQESKWALPANSLGVAAGLTGQNLIKAIMEEKFISNFLNIEVYNDWKRTNLPAIVPYGGLQIPRRYLYGSAERNANPNIPSPSAQPLRNANDPGDNY